MYFSVLDIFSQYSSCKMELLNISTRPDYYVASSSGQSLNLVASAIYSSYLLHTNSVFKCCKFEKALKFILQCISNAKTKETKPKHRAKHLLVTLKQ